MNKFWEIKNSADRADIFIYGEISNYRRSESEVTAQSFVEDLKNVSGKETILHINSPGGDVFNALAIANVVKAEKISVTIDGLAASAASLIAVSGSKVTMAENALMMIHLPTVGLMGYFDEVELGKIKESLSKTKDALITTYASRMKDAEISALMVAETWFNAQEALAAGLIDEITPATDITFDNANKIFFVNNLELDVSRFDGEKIKKATELINMGEHKTDTAAIRAEIRREELKRIKDLQSLKGENAAVNALIEVALEDGKTVAEVEPYIAALKKIPSAKNAAEEICKTIADNMTSGAQKVGGSQNEVDEKEAQIQRIIAFGRKSQ